MWSFVKLDAGISAGIIADGRMLRGAGNIAGAAAWFALSEEFRDEYASRGCLETEAAGAALVRRTIEECHGGADSILSHLTVTDAAELTPAVIIRAARGGDALALKVITEACGWIGRGVAELISTLNPEVVVIGGELGLTLRPFLNLIRREARLWAHPTAARQCRILSSTLRQTAGPARRSAFGLAGNQFGGLRRRLVLRQRSRAILIQFIVERRRPTTKLQKAGVRLCPGVCGWWQPNRDNR